MGIVPRHGERREGFAKPHVVGEQGAAVPLRAADAT